ncbi:MAG: alkaline phosphatase family protein, partial [Blastocatellia bacterium]
MNIIARGVSHSRPARVMTDRPAAVAWARFAGTALRQRVLSLALMAVLLSVSAFSTVRRANTELKRTLILISLDGFRWDYLDRGVSPNINALASAGVRAKSLIPVFPSLTFPNHYSIVTGVYPEKHGIVGNEMYDPQFGASFSM